MKQKLLLFDLLFINIFATAQIPNSNYTVQNYLQLNRIDYYSNNEWINDSIAQNNQYFFVNENHGYKCNHEIFLKLIKELKVKTNFNYIIGKFDIYSAEDRNYITTQSKTQNTCHLDNLRGTYAWLKESQEFDENFKAYNQNLKDKIKYLGPDILISMEKASKEIKSIVKSYSIEDACFDSLIYYSNQPFSEIHIKYLYSIKDYSKETSFSKEDSFRFEYLLSCMKYYNEAVVAGRMGRWDAVRDSLVFLNFKKLIKHYKLENEKMIGMWGRNHGFQESSSGVKWFASCIKNELNANVYTYNFIYSKGKQLIPSRFVPKIIHPFSLRKLYLKYRITADDFFLSPISMQLKPFKEITQKKSITLFNLAEENSPFKTNRYLLGWPDDKSKSTTDFFQSVILIRNSKAATPLGENKN